MTSLGVNAERHRDHNRRLVLQALRRHGPLSRADLTRLTQLSPQAMTNIAAGLLQDGLIRQLGRRRGGRGQPPIALALDPDGALAIGIDVAPQALRAVLIDLLGNPLAQSSTGLASADPDAVARQIPGLLEPLFAAAARHGRPLLGVGAVMPASFPGPERPTELPGWERIGDPASHLAAAIGHDLSVTVAHDATAAAIAAQLHGPARQASRVTCLFLGHGIGLGLVLDGQVYRGAHGAAGEIGHVPVEPFGRSCFCGRSGCLEQYVSVHAVLRDLGLPGEEALDADDAQLGPWLDQAAPLLARAVVMVETLFDPDLVVLAGRSRALVAGLAARTRDLPARLAGPASPRLALGTSGTFCAAHAAASLPLHDHTTAATARAVHKPSRFAAEPMAEAS